MINLTSFSGIVGGLVQIFLLIQIEMRNFSVLALRLVAFTALFLSALCDTCSHQGGCKAKCGGKSFDLASLLNKR